MFFGEEVFDSEAEYWKDRWYAEVMKNIALQDRIEKLTKREGEQRAIIDQFDRDNHDYALCLDFYSNLSSAR